MTLVPTTNAVKARRNTCEIKNVGIDVTTLGLPLKPALLHPPALLRPRRLTLSLRSNFVLLSLDLIERVSRLGGTTYLPSLVDP